MARFVLVLLPADADRWERLTEELEGRGHEVLALRLSAATWEGAVGEVAEAAVGAIVVGHGEGALLVRSFAEHHPEHARALALIAPVPPSPGAASFPGPPPLPGGAGNEPALVIACEDDEVVPIAHQRAEAAALRAPVAQIPGGHDGDVRHPALVATLLVNHLVGDTEA